MNHRWTHLLHLIRLARLDLVVTAVSNSWLVVWFSLRLEPQTPSDAGLFSMSTTGALAVVALISSGLAAYGLALNDVLDARHDRTFRPQRPIPSGLSHTWAVVLALVALLVALCASVILGKEVALLCLFNAAGILFYSTTWKFMPSAGIVTLGLIRVLNMYTPNPGLACAWPVVLTLVHVMVCATIVHLWQNKRPRLRTRDYQLLIVGGVFWTGVVVMIMRLRSGLALPGETHSWIGPALAVLGFMVVGIAGTRRRARPTRAGRTGAQLFESLSILWLIVYDAAWLFATGLKTQGFVHLCLFFAAVGLGHLLTVAAEISQHRPTYQVSNS